MRFPPGREATMRVTALSFLRMIAEYFLFGVNYFVDCSCKQAKDNFSILESNISLRDDDAIVSLALSFLKNIAEHFHFG